ncbi:MAG TPA: hypothetical protein PLL72_06935 [Burkholderiaceae bacterium]|nr:hypothetical protein [Burkholderiaceae bacterium]
MGEGVSHRIVAFIAHLQPIYVEAWIGERLGARSLLDGTLILPVEEPEDGEVGWVEVHWQGDPARRSVVQGAFLASVAVARYVEVTARPDSAGMQARYADLSRHFNFKTGVSLTLEEPDPERALAATLKAAVKRLGKEAVIDIVKKAMGL